MKPALGSYPSYLENYIRLADANSVEELIDKYSDDILKFFKKIPGDKVDYRYAEGKWTMKQMLQHIIDAERVFSYRVLRIARQDTTPLPGFDENDYANAAFVDSRSWKNLFKEFKTVRKATDMLLQSLTHEQLSTKGTTNSQPNTALAIAYAIYGHALHHINVAKERYLK